MKKKILTALLSLVIAFVLWSYVITVVNPEATETFRDIPVTFQGVAALDDRNLMLLMEETPTVTLELSGNRTDLNKLTVSNISVTVDLSKIYDPGKNAVLYNVSFPGNVANDAITTQSRTPSGITLEIARRDSRDVPVEVDYKGTLPEGFIKDKPVLEMEDIRILGPENVVSQIASARILVDLENQNQSITGDYAYTLCDKDGNPVDAKYIDVTTENAEEISLTLPIQRVKEIPLHLQVVSGGGATEDNSTILIAPRSIQISGSEANLEKLNELTLGAVNLGEISEDTLLSFPIVLPEGVVNETGITEATVSVSFPDLATRTIKVTKFTPKNVPKGMEATISTLSLEVTVRGERSKVDALTEDDIEVIVDFGKAQSGTQRLDVTVTVGEGSDQLGAMGTYSVLVSLTADKAKSADN